MPYRGFYSSSRTWKEVGKGLAEDFLIRSINSHLCKKAWCISHFVRITEKEEITLKFL